MTKKFYSLLNSVKCAEFALLFSEKSGFLKVGCEKHRFAQVRFATFRVLVLLSCFMFSDFCRVLAVKAAFALLSSEKQPASH